MKKINISIALATMVGLFQAHSATIVYNFDNALNVANAGGTGEEYSAPDSNDFGNGITISAFTMDPEVATQYSRITTYTGATSNLAAVQGRATGTVPRMQFTVNIPSNVTVDLTSLSFVHGAYRAGAATDFNWSIALSQGSADITAGLISHDGGTNFQSASNTLALSGLTGLTNTSVTFDLSFTAGTTTSIGLIANTLDDIVLTGTAVAIPEPSTFALLGLGLGTLLLVRRGRS